MFGFRSIFALCFFSIIIITGFIDWLNVTRRQEAKYVHVFYESVLCGRMSRYAEHKVTSYIHIFFGLFLFVKIKIVCLAVLFGCTHPSQTRNMKKNFLFMYFFYKKKRKICILRNDGCAVVMNGLDSTIANSFIKLPHIRMCEIHWTVCKQNISVFQESWIKFSPTNFLRTAQHNISQ